MNKNSVFTIWFTGAFSLVVVATFLFVTERETLPHPSRETIRPTEVAPTVVGNEVALTTGEPTSVPSVIALPPTPLEFSFDHPAEYNQVVQWLLQAKQSGQSAEFVQAELVRTGWLTQQKVVSLARTAQAIPFAAADVNGDGVDEWLIMLTWGGRYTNDYSGATVPSTGEFLVLSGNGILYHSLNDNSPSCYHGPQLISVQDFTGDNQPDLLIERVALCTENITLYSVFSLLSWHSGTLSDLAPSELKEDHLFHMALVTFTKQPSPSDLLEVEIDFLATDGRQKAIYRWDGISFKQQTISDVYDPVAVQTSWLSSQYQIGRNTDDVKAELEVRGWFRHDANRQTDFADTPLWINADLDGDGQDEWIIRVTNPDSIFTPLTYWGDIWIVTSEGVFRDSNNNRSSGMASYAIELLPDMTGDTLPELLTLTWDCGVNLCHYDYCILSTHNGDLTNLVLSPAESPRHSFEISPATLTLQDFNKDGLPDITGYKGGRCTVTDGCFPEYWVVWGWDPSLQAITQLYLQQESPRQLPEYTNPTPSAPRD